tara:strand:+ start:71265 stop:71813 length:549 start_codon:yes stop_codon:yes gene_type:complete
MNVFDVIKIKEKKISISSDEFDVYDFFIIDEKTNDVVFEKKVLKSDSLASFKSELDEVVSPYMNHPDDLFFEKPYDSLFESENYTEENKPKINYSGLLVFMNDSNLIWSDKVEKERKIEKEKFKKKMNSFFDYLSEKTQVPRNEVGILWKDKTNDNVESVYRFLKKMVKLDRIQKKALMQNI